MDKSIEQTQCIYNESNKSSKWLTFQAIAILFAVVVSGGCGGNHSNNGDNDGNAGSCTSKVNSTEQKIEEKYESYEQYAKDLRNYVGDYALRMGAVLAFVDIMADDINYVTDILSLDLLHYLPDNATEEEIEANMPFQAAALRVLDGYDIDFASADVIADDDEEVESTEILDYFTYFCSDILRRDMIVWFTSGDQEISLDARTIIEDSQNITLDDVKIIGDVDDQAMNNFLAWVNELNGYGAYSLLDEADDSSAKATAKDFGNVEMSYAVSGQNISYNFNCYSSPRKYYFTKNLGIAGSVYA